MAIAMEFDAATRGFVRREMPRPEPKPGEVLVRVRCCTLCGSDLHTYSGRRASPQACVLGHEIIGDVESWGDGAVDFRGKPLQVGQRITWTMAVGCGSCYYCRSGLTQKCESLFKYGHEPAHPANRPTGGLSDFCLLTPGTPIFPLPDRLPDAVAAPANCATATVSAALRLVRQTHEVVDASVLITGAGMLGLTAAAQFREAGAAHVAMLDPSAPRRSLALRFGVNAVAAQLDSSVHGEGQGSRGFDIALDFAGVVPAVQSCLDAVRIGGCVLLAGSVFPTESVQLAPEQVVRKMLTLRGLHNYVAADLQHALGFLERSLDNYPFAELVSAVYPLSQTADAFAHFESERPVRIAVQPDRE